MHVSDGKSGTRAGVQKGVQPAGKKLKVVLQYNSLPHYREALFTLLSHDREIDYLIVADRKSETAHMQVIERPEEKFRYAPAQLFQLRLGAGIRLFWQPSAVRICWNERPDAIIALANPYSLTAWAILLLGWIKGIPVLLWGHGLLEHETGPKWWIRKIFYELATCHLLYGDRAKQLMMARGFQAHRLFVVYNSLDYDAQCAVAERITEEDTERFRTEIGLTQNMPLVVFTGRLQVEKRLDILLQAIATLRDRGREVHVALIGEGDERGTLECLARELRVERQVHFLGASYEERFLGTVFKASGACVIPSAAGLTVTHALVYGTPVIINDRQSEHAPETEAVQEGVTGYFYRFGDSAHLSEKIELAVFGAVDQKRMRGACEAVIRDRYNPHVQVMLFAEAVTEKVLRPGLCGIKVVLKEAAKAARMWALRKTKLRHVKLGRGAHFARRVAVHQPGIEIGDYVYIGPNCEIAPEVKIGNYTCLSSYVVIAGGDHRFDVAGVPIRFSGRPESVSTEIGSDVLIGHGATVMRGVSIGDGAVVGSGAVVTRDIPAYSVVGGVPAKIIRSRFNEAERKRHVEMLSSPTRYWGNLPKPS